MVMRKAIGRHIPYTCKQKSLTLIAVKKKNVFRFSAPTARNEGNEKKEIMRNQRKELFIVTVGGHKVIAKRE